MVGVGFVMAMTAPIELIFARHLGAGVVALAIYTATPGIGMLLVDVLGSRFVPRLDARTVVAIGVGLFGVSSILLAVSPDYWPLLPARALQGLGGGFVLGAALQAAVRLNPIKHDALIAFNSAFLFGGVLGSPAGGYMAGTVAGLNGFRMTFATCAVLSALVGCLVWRLLPPLPPAHGAGRARLGWPRLAGGPPGQGPAMLLGTLGDFLRGGVVYTALPLVGQARHLSTATIGVAVGLLMAVEIMTVRSAAVGLLRFGVVQGLVAALTGGIGLATLIAMSSGTAPFILASLGFGVVVAATTIIPPLILVSLNEEDAAAGLASFRVSSGIGMLIGSTGGGAAVVLFGPTAAFLAVASVLVVGVGLAGQIGRQLPEPAAA
jgi:predicted MFS family arabinose efflux permease